MKLILVILLDLFTIIFAILQNQHVLNVHPALCTTPNRDVGICIEVQNCSIFMNAIKLQKTESYRFIRESQCGMFNHDAKHPHVCCGIYDNYLNQRTTVRTGKRLNVLNQNLFPESCGKSEAIVCRIYGGSEADLGEFPWMARLRHLRSDGLLSYGCAGFLISDKFVLTAAHCIYSQSLAQLGPIYQVQLGEHHTETDPDCLGHPQTHMCADAPQLLRTADPIVHPDYSNDNQHHNDIAIIPLEEPAKITTYVQPICLPKTSSKIPRMWVSGWGRTETNRSSNVKLSVSVPRADWTQCSSLYKTRGIIILDSQLCAGGEAGKDSCTGDSGGPLMVARNGTWYAEGIVSVGMGCGEKGLPAIYTNLHRYMTWIELVVGQYLEEHEEEAEGNEEQSGDLSQSRYIWNT